MRGRPPKHPRTDAASFTPRIEYHDSRHESWPSRIKGRHPMLQISVQMHDERNSDKVAAPDILVLSGHVGIEFHDMRLDKYYAQDVKTVREAEFIAICDLFKEQVLNSTKEVKGNLPLERMGPVKAPVSQFEQWSAAIAKRTSYTIMEMRLSASPNNQRMPTPDIVYLTGKVGGELFSIKLDKLYDEESKLNLKDQMIRIVDQFKEKMKTAMTFPDMVPSETKDS